MIGLGILILYIIIVVMIIFMIIFNPTIYVREEGIFLQFTIKSKFGEKKQ